MNENLRDEVLTEQIAESHFTLTVEQPQEGFWCSLRLFARVPMPPEEIYALLVSPKNHLVFRSLEPPRSRRILDDHGRYQTAEVEQVGRWRFGPFRGSFPVKLIIAQDRKDRTISFKLAPKSKGLMRDFTGEWKVQPYNQDSIDEMIRYPGRHWGPLHGFRKALHTFEESLIGRHAHESLVELRQSVAPAFLPPPPLDRILRKITAAQVQSLMVDLMAEAKRRNDSEEKTGKRVGAVDFDTLRDTENDKAGGVLLPFLKKL